MSKKTIKQRIAVVAALALGTGVLSVSPANAAAVLVNELTFVAAATQPGVCAIDSTSGAQGAVVVAGSALSMSLTQAAGTDDIYVSVSGNATIASASSGWEAVTLTTATNASAAASGQTITFRAGTVGTAAITVRGTSTTAVVEVASITVVASCTNNKLSLADSFIEVGAVATADDNIDDSAYTTVSNAATTYINIRLRDAYLSDLTGAGVLLATATNGAVVSWDGAATVQSSTAYLATRGVADTELYVVQGDANEDKPVTTTVTITLDGVAVATKTLTFRGVPASIVISGVKGGKVSGTNIFDARVLDAAGNGIPSQTVANDATANAATSVASISSGVSVSAVTHTDGTATSSSQGTRGNYNCTAAGKTTISVKTTISSVAGTSVKASFPVTCAAGLATWTVGLDKASYSPGEIATLTVTGKDSKGFEVNAIDTLGTLEQSFGGMTFVTAPSTADKFDSAIGSKTYTLAVGTSEGAFVGTFKITGSTDTAAKTVQYVVKSSTTSVSNADVLKSIVALIASINKQIQALQKLILKR
jgi:hypothetical protein